MTCLNAYMQKRLSEFIHGIIIRILLASVICFTVILISGASVLASGDPFQPYLNSDVPLIVKDMGESTNEDVIVKHVVFQSLKVDGDDETVYAIIARPVKEDIYPGILVLHGGGGSASEADVVKWAKSGYIALTLDIPGIADPKDCPNTTGAWKEVPYGENRFIVQPSVTSSTIFSGVVAEIKAFNLLASQPGIDKERIGVTGESWGGYSTVMLSGLLGDRICAAYSIYGSGYFDKGTVFSGSISKLSDSDKETWLNYLDAGRRASGIKSKFFLAAAVRDKFFYPPSVNATIDDILGQKNLAFASESSHSLGGIPGGNTSLQYFDYYLKDKGLPFPEINIESFTTEENGGKLLIFSVDASEDIGMVKFYYSLHDDMWSSRSWSAIDAKSLRNNRFMVELSEKQVKQNIDWYIIASDKRPVTGGSRIYRASDNLGGEYNTGKYPEVNIIIPFLPQKMDQKVSQRGLELNPGEGIKIKPKVVGTKGDIINTADTQITYLSNNENVVKISGDGVISAISGGVAEITLKMKMESQVKEFSIPVEVGGVLANIDVSTVESDASTGKDTLSKRIVFLESESLKLKVMGKTRSGVDLNLDSIEYTSLNDDILSVDNEGIVTAHKLGEGKIKIDVRCNGIALSTDITLKAVKDYVPMADIEKWTVTGSNAVKENIAGGIMLLTPEGAACFEGRKYQDEMMDFDMKVDLSASFNAIGIRQQDPKGDYNSTSMYMVIINKDKIELHRFNEGKKRTVIYGNKGIKGDGFDVINTIDSDQMHHIQFGAINSFDAVRVILRIDNKSIFDFTDQSEDRISDAGYFSVIAKKKIEMLSRDQSEESIFEDTKDHWAREEIKQLVMKNIIKGVDETHFAPEQNISRAEFLALIVRTVKLREDGYKNTLKDVVVGDWFANIVQSALNANLIDEEMYKNAEFNPNSPITREEMTSFLIKAYYYLGGNKITGDINIFEDKEQIAEWAKEYVEAAKEIGIISGITTTQFAPKENATRAQAAVMIIRFINTTSSLSKISAK